MEGPLTKRQLCWVIIRGIGAYLVLQGVSSFFVSISMAASMSQINPISGGNPFPVTMFLVACGITAVGVYLLVSGEFVFNLLMREPSDRVETEKLPSGEFTPTPLKRRKVDPQDIPDSATTLTPRERADFDKWLGDHPEFASRAESDRIALFRDSQKSDEAKR